TSAAPSPSSSAPSRAMAMSSAIIKPVLGMHPRRFSEAAVSGFQVMSLDVRLIATRRCRVRA
ncbi:MAG: hypothetical protein M3451_07580, partial [Chloroflexota bacterium]|nr:hypothetical protein [Chloroflexota bacterium]